MPPLVETLEPLRIKKVAVLGAGPTGVGISAHLANLGFDVTLLDTSIERAEDSIAKAIQAKVPQFYTPETADKVRCGSADEHLTWLADVDWVCESVGEDESVKKSVFSAIEPVIPGHTVVTTATGVLDVAELSREGTESFRRRFLGAHFMPFPRRAKLLELTPTPDTDQLLTKRLTQFFEDKVGRRVIVTKGTPGFIADRLGIWEIMHAVHVAEKLRLDIELVDAATAAILGTPGQGVTRLADALGLDFLADVAAGIAARCADDPQRGLLSPPSSLAALLERGCVGDKVGRGFNRSEGSEALVLDLVTLAYRQRREPSLDSLAELAALPVPARLKAGLALRDEVGEFLRTHFLPVLRNADRLKETIGHSVWDIDHAMMWAFGRERGPFAMIDDVGPETLGIRDGPFYSDGRFRSFSGAFMSAEPDHRYRPLTDYPVVREDSGCVVRDLGDSVNAVSLAPANGLMSPSLVEDVHRLLDSGVLDRFVLTFPSADGPFTYDLPFILGQVAAGEVMAIEMAVRRFQELNAKLSGLRCVALVESRCVGAFLETAMQCPVIVAHPEASLGLNLSHAGLIPAGGGLAAMRLRTQESGPRTMADAAMQVLSATTSACAEEGRRKGFLRLNDKIVNHSDRLVWEAKEVARIVEPKPAQSWIALGGPLAGVLDRRRDELKGRSGLTAHDELIAEKVKLVFARATSYSEALALERRGFLELCSKALTHARMRHLVSHGTPLRN